MPLDSIQTFTINRPNCSFRMEDGWDFMFSSTHSFLDNRIKHNGQMGCCKDLFVHVQHFFFASALLSQWLLLSFFFFNCLLSATFFYFTTIYSAWGKKYLFCVCCFLKKRDKTMFFYIIYCVHIFLLFLAACPTTTSTRWLIFNLTVMVSDAKQMWYKRLLRSEVKWNGK